MPTGVVRRVRRGHHTRDAQGDAPTNNSLAARARCAELPEHHRWAAYPPDKAMGKGVLWEGGSTRGSRNLLVAVVLLRNPTRKALKEREWGRSSRAIDHGVAAMVDGDMGRTTAVNRQWPCRAVLFIEKGRN
jgi:hypothetical protein